ncbi:MAG: hypothetical protein U9O94_09470 [Nanoarchaeota archaeon]|nr:hypothetical protein [Nanoarchaeota archaeon]
MRKEEKSQIMFFLGAVFVISALLSGISMITMNVIGIGEVNSTSTKAYIWNSEPNITLVFIDPNPVIDLTPGNTTQVNCTAYIWDYNGAQDIQGISGSLYYTSAGDGLTADNNYRYINSSCGNLTTGACTVISAYNTSCKCSFNVLYYANSGTWTCNMTVTDRGGNATERIRFLNDSLTSSTVTINPLLGVVVPNELDYGNLSVTETSSQLSANVRNGGNVPINISIRGWGGTTDYASNLANTAMLCEYGNISIANHKYSTNISQTFANMTNLTSNLAGIHEFNLSVRKDDLFYTNDSNVTYWRLQIPMSVAGQCNGTIQFSAVDIS